MNTSQKTAEITRGGLLRFNIGHVLQVLAMLALLAACHGQALLPSAQYGFRDAAHFYYPLNLRVQMEWDAGRWPLWEPEENGGVPLLGNPTAAVLYPLKIVFFILPYPAAAKAYILIHQVLCWFSFRLLCRGIGLSSRASWLGATTFAFGVPVLYQYCNIIFLIGAAWLPLGLLAGWRWIETGQWKYIVRLALVIAMQILGGDPQVGYITLLCLFGLGFWQGLTDRSRLWLSRLCHPAMLFFWVLLLVGGTVLASHFPRPPREVRIGGISTAERLFFSRNLWQMVGWGLVGLVLVNRWRRGWKSQVMPRHFAGVIMATILGAGLSAAQLLPVFEYNSLSIRAAAEGPHDIFPFSLEPYRLVELIWPRPFGTVEGENSYWMNLLPPRNNHKQWVPSLYHGLPAFLLAASVLGFRRVDPRVKACSILLAVSLLAAIGEFTGPLWWLRRLPGLEAASFVGPPDETDVAAIRLDGYSRDGDGSFYWLLAEIFPGFRTFRYPAKMLTFASLAIALLAGLAWDTLASAGLRKRLIRLLSCIIAVSLILVIGLLLFSSSFKGWMQAADATISSAYGPVSTDSALRKTIASLLHSAVVSVSLLFLLKYPIERSRVFAGFCLLVVVDLAMANAIHVRFVPQALFDAESKITKIIEEAEKASPTPGGYYRVHRMPIWNPPGWNLKRSPDRTRDFVEWEHSTIQPKYGITQGVSYTITEGTTELYDYWWFFGPFLRRANPEAAQALGIAVGSEIAYHPRRGFDMWNTRYFVTPGWPSDWKDDKRSFASFLFETEPLYPDTRLKTDKSLKNEFEVWAKEEDVQIFRNKQAFPRAWIVHEMRNYPHVTGLKRRDREAVMTEILYQNDPFWRDSGREAFDPGVTCWIDQADQPKVAPFMPGRVRQGSSESVKIDSYSPQRVELTANLEKPGMVILADVYYNGWILEVDGKPAEIIRANRMMRGALLPSGTHKLVYTYAPSSFRLGGRISIASGLALMALSWLAYKPGKSTKGSPGLA